MVRILLNYLVLGFSYPFWVLGFLAGAAKDGLMGGYEFFESL